MPGALHSPASPDLKTRSAAARREVFEGIDPASTAVEVSRLVSPEFVVEIEADAIVTG